MPRVILPFGLSGGTNVSGTFVVTQPADAPAASATVTDRATIAVTQPADTPNLQSKVTDRASIAVTQPADTSAIGVSVGNAVSGTFAVTQPADTPAIAGTVTNRASFAATQPAETPTSAATVTNRGSIAVTHPADTPALGVTVGAPSATINVTQPADVGAIVARVPETQTTGGYLPPRRKRRDEYEFLDPFRWRVEEVDEPEQAQAAQKVIRKRVKTLEGWKADLAAPEAPAPAAQAAAPPSSDMAARDVQRWIDEYNRIAAEYRDLEIAIRLRQSVERRQIAERKANRERQDVEFLLLAA